MEIKKCKGCGVALVFLPTQNGRRMPVRSEMVNVRSEPPPMFDPAIHKSHFVDCKDAQKFRKPKVVRDSFNTLDEKL